MNDGTNNDVAAEKTAGGGIEFMEHIEPPFYGTGPIITWEPKVLLNAIDRKRFFTMNEIQDADADQLLDACIEQIQEKSLIEPCALYGYFPVISDKEQVIMLDPSDFLSEQVTLRFPRNPDNGNRSLADFLRPEGDLIAIQMVTIGKNLEAWCSSAGESSDRQKSIRLMNGLAAYLVNDLVERITLEITRGLFLPDGAGMCALFGTPGMPRPEEQQPLLEYLSIEERMGVSLAGDFSLDSKYSRLGVYFRHPDAPNC